MPSGETDELSEIQIDARVVQRLLAKKRAEKDVVWVVCLDQKLVQIDDALGSARDARNGLSEADEHGDLSLAEHQKTILGVLRQRADRLREEGMRCDNLR